MESRKAWRNRDPSAAAGVLALLEALRDGLGAPGVGLFDDDRADSDPDSAPGRDAARGALNFWDAFDERPCAEIDWETWYGELRRRERVETTCGCGASHRLCGFLIHGRWALLVVAPPVLPAGGAAGIASSLRALADRLPPAKSRAEIDALAQYQDAPTADATATGGAMWWVRKLRQ